VTGVNFGFSFNPVVNTRDGDDDGAANRTIQGSLRQFIQNANAVAGIQSSQFRIPAAIAGANGQFTIQPTSTLPTLSDPAVLDGTTQTASIGDTNAAGPEIEIDGSLAGAGANGVNLAASNSTLRGLVINRFSQHGVYISGGVSGNFVMGNYIGTDVTGTVAAGNGWMGVEVAGASTGNRIGGTAAVDRNVISGNGQNGVSVIGGSDSTLIQGNYIGVNAAGTAAIPNTLSGIGINGASSITIGGNVAGAGNVISGNSQQGIWMNNSSGSFIQGNTIGLNAAGDAAVANGVMGIVLEAGVTGVQIGGATAVERNVISGNTGDGIFLNGADSTTIEGNYIGTNLSGNADLGNGGDGILADNSSDNTVIVNNVISGNNDDGIDLKNSTAAAIQGNYIGVSADGLVLVANVNEGILIDNSSGSTIGGTNATERNIVSGHVYGIRLNGAGATGNTIQGNYIGTDVNGTANFGNTGHGVTLRTGAANNTIGGTVAGAGNLIAFNGIGVVLEATAGTGNAIQTNAIHSNTGLGIDLGNDGVTANDAGDGDTGPNNLQNWPELSKATSDVASTTITGRLDSTPSTTFRLEFFSSSVVDPSGNGEGEIYLGFDTVTTNGGGNVNFNIVMPFATAVGYVITATATDPNGNTSEFSNAEIVSDPYTISGTVYEDINGDASLADALTLAGVAVSIYDDGGDGQPDGIDDNWLGTTTTNASGNFLFANLPNSSTYWILVDSKTVPPSAGINGGFAQGDVWAEQTYGTIGAWCDDGAGGVSELGAAGACYGGQAGTVSDDASSLASAEHVTRVAIAGSNVSGVNFGFSFNPVVNTRDDVDDDAGANRWIQGSLRQFILNANAVNGPNTMRFVPAGPTNAAGGGGNWWRINPTTAFPDITDSNTIIDGRAYSRADGVSIIDSNPGQLGAGGNVGVDGLALSQVAKPELEVADTAGLGPGLNILAADVTVRRLSLWGFGTAVLADGHANIRVGNVTGALIEQNILGTPPDSFTDPGAARTGGQGIWVQSGDTGTIQNNLIGFNESFGIFLFQGANTWLVENNEIRSNALGSAGLDGIDINNSSASATIRGNLFAANLGSAVDMFLGGGSNVIENNTMTGNGIGGVEDAGVRILADNNAIRRNIITASAGSGIMIVNDAATNPPHEANLISQNVISNSGKIGIDLHTVAEDPALGTNPYVTPNDVGDPDGGANQGQNYPVLTSAGSSGGNTTIIGTLNSIASTTYTIEFYSNNAADPEGEVYLGSDTVTTDGSGNATINTMLAVAVAAGDVITATAIDPADNTSEFSAPVTVTAVAQIELSAASASDAENSGGNLPVLLINGNLTVAQTIDVTVTGGTATGGGVDYTNTVQVTIPAGVYDGTLGTAVAITLTISDDGLLEGDETIDLALQNPSAGLTIADADGDTTTQNSHIYTITDDEVAAADVQLTAATDGAEPATDPTFTVTLSSINNTGSPITVSYVYNNGGTDTATAGSDYDNSTTSVDIPVGSDTATITVPVTDDGLLEGTETLSVTITACWKAPRR
jgi:parallel beta-helix repeat protein